MVDGAGAAAGESAGIATEKSEGTIGLGDGEILRLNGGHAVEVGEVVKDEVAGFSFGSGALPFGIENEMAAPGWETMVALGAGGVCLARELGHAIFVVQVIEGEFKEGGQFLVELGFGKIARGALVTAGFEQMGSFGKSDGPVGLHEMQKGEGRPHEKDGLTGPEVI